MVAADRAAQMLDAVLGQVMSRVASQLPRPYERHRYT
jgi:hypothetical protein